MADHDRYAISRAPSVATPTGKKHLHFTMRSEKELWVIRTRKSHLCGTPRCRLVNIKELK